MEAKKHKVVPYADAVTFYTSSTKAVPVWRGESKKGWVDVFVGEFTAKSRFADRLGTINELLLALVTFFLFGFAFFFASTSAHSMESVISPSL